MVSIVTSPSLPATPRPMPHAPAPRQGTRLVGLDGLRGIAALAVMVDHFSEPAIGRWIPLGPWAVSLFFVLSGFVILMTVEHAPGRADFIWNRAARLYPAFGACVLLTAAVLAVAVPALHPTARQFLANLTMFPGLFGEPGLDTAYWTLAWEGLFYAVCLLTWPLLKSGRMEWVGAVWLAEEALETLLHGTPAFFVDARYGHLFVAGMCLWRLRQGVRWQTVALLAASLAFDPWHAPQYAALVWLVARLPDVPRPLRWLGAISYPLYLCNNTLGSVAIALLLSLRTPTPIAITVAAIAVLATAFAIHRGVEEPGRRWLRDHPPRFAGVRLRAPGAT